MGLILYKMLDCNIIILHPLLMIEANNIIFPYPKHDQEQQNYLKYIKKNIIFIPKRNHTPIGCLCQTIINPNTHISSTITTARTLKSDAPSQTIKIQSSKQLQVEVMKGKHKRCQTKVISIISARYTNTDQNTQRNINTLRNIHQQHFDQHMVSKQIKANLAKNKNKFRSDDLYRQEQSQQFENGGKVQTVRTSKVPKRFAFECNLTSQLWKYQQNQSNQSAVPCLYFQSSHNNSKIMIYFHGNGQDLTGCHSFLKHLSTYTQTSVLAIQYPGYSLYSGNPSSQLIENDGCQVMQFLKNQIGFDLHNIMIIGRSIGSGPALHIASHYQIGGLVLLSPFLSICEVVYDLYGTFASGLLKQRFDNKQRAKLVQSPCMIVHGTKDKLISSKHATQLSQYFKGYTSVKIIKEMSHSVFCHEQFFGYVNDFQADICFID